MGTLLVVENVSLDGVAQSPGRPDEDTRGGFHRGGWASAWFAQDPEAATAAMSGSGGTSAFLFGRRTYEDLVGYWLTTPEPNPFADILRSTPKYVATRSRWLVGRGTGRPRCPGCTSPSDDARRRGTTSWRRRT